MADPKEWFNVEEAAEYLCVSRRTIYNMVKEGRLAAYRIGQERHRRFKRHDLDKAPQKCTVSSAEASETIMASADPVLAALWDNEKDAAYDRL